MNNLSWLIYWADTLPRFAASIGVVCTIAEIFCSAMTVLFFTAGFG